MSEGKILETDLQLLSSDLQPAILSKVIINFKDAVGREIESGDREKVYGAGLDLARMDQEYGIFNDAKLKVGLDSRTQDLDKESYQEGQFLYLEGDLEMGKERFFSQSEVEDVAKKLEENEGLKTEIEITKQGWQRLSVFKDKKSGTNMTINFGFPNAETAQKSTAKDTDKMKSTKIKLWFNPLGGDEMFFCIEGPSTNRNSVSTRGVPLDIDTITNQIPTCLEFMSKVMRTINSEQKIGNSKTINWLDTGVANSFVVYEGMIFNEHREPVGHILGEGYDNSKILGK